MNRASSWTNKEPDFSVREAAMGAARRAGLSLQEWLDETWRLHASEIRASIDDLDEDERAYAVARRLSRMRTQTAGARRSDRYGSEAAANRRSDARQSDEQIWARVNSALGDLDEERGGDARRDFAEAAEAIDPPAARPSARPAASPPARPAARPSRFSLEAAIGDIAERQIELERVVPRNRDAEEAQAAAPLKRELAKVAEALSELRRDANEGARAGDIDALRRDVHQIARGLSALAPRESIDHIEASVNDLGRRLAEARTAGLVDEFIAPVEALIGDLKRTLLGAAPTAALDAIERRIGALGRNVDALAESRVDPDSVASLLEHSQDIRDMLRSAAANRPNIEGLERRIADLAGRIDRIAERGQTSAGLDAILQSVAQVRVELEQQNPIKAVKALDGRIDALARKMDQAASRSDVDAHFERLSRRLDAMHRDLAERAPEGRRLEEMFQTLQARIDQARPAAGPAEMRDLVGQLMGRIDQAIRAGAEPSSLGALEDQIARVAARLDVRPDAQPSVAAGELARIETILNAISQRLDNPLPIAAADQVQETVRLLIERFEATVRNGVTGETLAAIERRLADVAARLEAPVTAELDTGRLESMIQGLAARMEDPRSAPCDVTEIKETLAQIADRMDAALRNDGDQSALRGLEAQIAALAQRMETEDRSGVGRLERALDDIHSQMEQLRGELDSPARETIEREIADLRSLHSASDRRTHATLNAVHETLEKVVDRLAMLEDELEAATKNGSPRPPGGGAPPPKDTDGYRPSIELNFDPVKPESAPPAGDAPGRPSAAATHVAPTPDPPAPSRAPITAAALDPVRAAPQIIAERLNADTPRRPSAPKIESPVGDDFLLEPGSGKPSERVVAAALQNQIQVPAAAAGSPAANMGAAEPAASPLDAAIADAETDPNAQASFIAAIRRAQQAADAAEASSGASTGAQLLEEARARARAAAEAEAEAQQAKGGNGPFGLKSLFSGRKRSTTAVGLTGLVVVLGGLQAASMFYQTEKSRSLRSAADSPAPSAPLQPEKTAMRAESPNLGGLAPPSERFTQAPALADMTPVASVPVTGASAREPAPASDPFILAGAGDAHAQYELGVRYAEGRHAPRDAAKALDWLTRSAAQNFPPAQYRLGVIYEKGIGVTRDAARARALYLAAAERGNVKAMHNLGALLADGGAEGKPDYAAAVRWFRQAAEHGVRDSQYNLAILSARGLGLQQDLVESYVWFSAAAAQGDSDAAAKLKEVASRLDAAQTARAQATAKAQRPKVSDPRVNEPIEPEGGWAVSPEPLPNKPTASRAPKISSLQVR